MFTILNAARLALMQVGVLTIGVLGAGLHHKIAAMGGWQPPLLIRVITDYGFVSLVIPLIWITVAACVHRMSVSDTAKNMVFLSGAVLVAVIIVFFIITDFGLGYEL